MGDKLPREQGPLPIEGIVNLLNTKKEMTLKIVGSVPLHAMPKSPAMKIVFNGETLDEFVPLEGQLEKVYTIPALKQTKEEYSELRIATNQFFIPAERDKKSKDHNRRAFQLTKLTWAEKEGDIQAADLGNSAGPAAGPQKTGSRPWLLALLLLGLGTSISLVLFLAARLFFHQRRTAKMPAGAIANDKEVNPEETKIAMAGKTEVKCPHCGKAVLLPVTESGKSDTAL
jgi:hypothetical protein